MRKYQCSVGVYYKNIFFKSCIAPTCNYFNIKYLITHIQNENGYNCRECFTFVSVVWCLMRLYKYNRHTILNLYLMP